MLTTVYFLQAHSVNVQGLNHFALPGQYLDIEEQDAIDLQVCGVILFDNEGVKNDDTTKPSYSTRATPDRSDTSENISKSRRNGRRHTNKHTNKRSDKKT